MAFELRSLGRRRVRYNSDNDDNPLTYQLVADGAKATPTAGAGNNTITIYAPGNTTAILAATDLTISGTLLTHSVDTTTVATWPIGTGYRAEIKVTSGGLTYDRHFMFDVVRFVVDYALGSDQLISLDDNVRGMVHDGDPEFASLLIAMADVIQGEIETKVVESDNLLENMILDTSLVSVCLRFLTLRQLWANNGDIERRDYYDAEYRRMLKSVLASVKFDVDQSGDEPDKLGGIQAIRLRS